VSAANAAPEQALKAMDRLCRRYREPIYAFIRRQGVDHHQAEDFTQGFFEFAIERSVIQRARKEKGRFRSFLLAALKNYLINLHDRATAAKRGGAHQFVSLDDSRCGDLPDPNSANDSRDFDHAWAVALIGQVMDGLADDYARHGQAEVHRVLRPHLASEPSREDFERAAAALGVSVNAVQVALIRLRRRFGKLLRAEVAHTVAGPEDIEEEIRHLMAVLAEG
jgi:RNA polymerase sigma-70 factor (ECF subfamily)